MKFCRQQASGNNKQNNKKGRDHPLVPNHADQIIEPAAHNGNHRIDMPGQYIRLFIHQYISQYPAPNAGNHPQGDGKEGVFFIGGQAGDLHSRDRKGRQPQGIKENIDKFGSLPKSFEFSSVYIGDQENHHAGCDGNQKNRKIEKDLRRNIPDQNIPKHSASYSGDATNGYHPEKIQTAMNGNQRAGNRKGNRSDPFHHQNNHITHHNNHLFCIV